MQCYASNKNHEDEDKDQFYNRLKAVLEKLQENHISILMGDSNAEIRSDKRGFKACKNMLSERLSRMERDLRSL